MGTISGTLKAYTGKDNPRNRDGLRPSKRNGYVPFKVQSTLNNMLGVVWINKESIVGAGGTGFTVTDDSSTIVLTE